MIRPRTLILVIGSHALEGVLTRHGRVLAERTHHVDADSMRTAWETGLASLDSSLEVLCVKLGCARGDRVVVLARPSVSGTVHREVPLNDATGQRANELVAAHACTGFDSHELCTRSRSWKVGGGPIERRVVLSGSVPDAVLVEVSEWVSRAGLRFDGFVPLQMWETERAMRAAESCEPGTVCCRIGPEYTVLVVRAPGQTPVVRAVEFGTQVLANVYARAAGHRGMAADPEGSWRLMLDHGVRWSKGAEVPDAVRDALPMLAPVLQRLNIELKQTLRYQVSPETETTSLRCLGIGRDVPGLGAAIAAHLELTLEPSEAHAIEASTRPSLVRELDPAALRALCDREHFVPRSESRARRVRQLASVAAQSGVIAAMMVFGEHRILGHQARQNATRLAELNQTLEAHESTAVLGRRLREDQNTVIDQLLMIDQAAGHAPPWAAVLRELTECEGLEFDSVRVSSDQQRAFAVVSGRTSAVGGDQLLRDRMARWREAGFIRSVEPTSLVRQAVGQSESLSFSLEFELQRFPVWFHHDELAGVTRTGGDVGQP